MCIQDTAITNRLLTRKARVLGPEQYILGADERRQSVTVLFRTNVAIFANTSEGRLLLLVLQGQDTGSVARMHTITRETCGNAIACELIIESQETEDATPFEVYLSDDVYTAATGVKI